MQITENTTNAYVLVEGGLTSLVVNGRIVAEQIGAPKLSDADAQVWAAQYLDGLALTKTLDAAAPEQPGADTYAVVEALGCDFTAFSQFSDSWVTVTNQWVLDMIKRDREHGILADIVEGPNGAYISRHNGRGSSYGTYLFPGTGA